MCGLAGFFEPSGVREPQASAILSRMGEGICHRGPDGSGTWLDSDAGIGFSHRRLAIVELSSAGAQPMRSPSGRLVIAYNGEIYNHLEIRREIETRHTVQWTGGSDTETLLAAIEAWGIERALRAAKGMFAFALWDRRDRTLTLSRDRAGEKPLYYGWQPGEGSGVLLFGSELKALAKHPRFCDDIDRDALSKYMRYGYVPAPWSIYGHIHKVEPGTAVVIRGRGGEDRIIFWSALDVAERGIAARRPVNDEEAIDRLEGCLSHAVSRQMMADVPLGALLSGGIDSSLIVALMQKHSPRPVKTFTIGFEEKTFDEAVHGAAVARHLGTEHQEATVTSADALDIIPRLPSMYDEPFADSSQIPTYIVSRLARSHVKVVLSGDGADELFGGYDHYGIALRFWKTVRMVPQPVTNGAAALIEAGSPSFWNGLGRFVKSGRSRSPFFTRMRRGARLLRSSSPAGISLALMERWTDAIVLGGRADDLSRFDWPQSAEPLDEMMLADFRTYLSDSILVKVDRASMASSLEVRAPYLDPDVVELAWGLPLSMKRRDGVSKWVNRQLLARYLPTGLIDRPKMGFSVPIDSWLRGTLRDWAEELLGEQQLTDSGLDATSVRASWSAHLQGQSNEQAKLWTVLMFQAWRMRRDQN